MMHCRSKNCKSQTSGKGGHSHPKLTQLIGLSKKSDPFLRQLRDVYDKENIHPNTKQTRVKSHSAKQEHHLDIPGKSPHSKQAIPPKAVKTSQIFNTTKSDCLGSNAKYNSSQLQRGSKMSNRKSTQKDQGIQKHFQEQYYKAKEERREKKMRVTLKDINKKRRSIVQADQDYMVRYQESTKDSIARELIGSLKKQIIKSSEKKSIEPQSAAKSIAWFNQYHCMNHPEKRATHRLLEPDCSTFCQKCAICLVTKGHKMEQLSLQGNSNRLSTRDNDIKQERLERLKDFLFQVDRLEPCFTEFRKDLDNYRNVALRKYQNQKQTLQTYYERIRQELQQSQQKSLLNLRIFFDSVLQELDKNQQALLIHHKQVKQVKEDILPNINCIVEPERVTQQSFEEIISNYCKNLRLIEFHLKEISQTEYNAYYYNYKKSQDILGNLKQFFSPEICITGINDIQETQREQTGGNEKRMEHFRMSFGKDINENQEYQTL